MTSTNSNSSIQFSVYLLKYVYGLIALIAGLDKFFNILVNWEKYIPDYMTLIIPLEEGNMMIVVGIIEISAGLLILLNPKLGGIIIFSWLLLVAIILISSGKYFDVAIRDIVMASGALVLAILYPSFKKGIYDQTPNS